MRLVILILFTLLCAVPLCGCGDKAEELYKTAQFEEQQFNKPNAARLYQRIVDDYPDSPYASQAKQRLQQLNP